VAEAILADKQTKEFSLEEASSVLAALGKLFPRFSQYFLVRERPADAGYGDA